MAKLITPLSPVPVSAFHISESSLTDVLELGVFSAYQGYIYNARCVQEVDGRPPTWCITLTPRGVEARKTIPTLTVLTGEWVVWENGTFSVKSDADVSTLYDVADAPPPWPEPEPEPEDDGSV